MLILILGLDRTDEDQVPDLFAPDASPSEELSTAEGSVAAEAVMLNLLATVKAEVGELSRVTHFVTVVVFVISAPHYTEQHVVAAGATDLLVRTFGDRIGRPARSAVGSPDCRSGSPWRSRPLSRRPLKPPATGAVRAAAGAGASVPVARARESAVRRCPEH